MSEMLSAQHASLSLTIKSAGWINVDTAKIQINGDTVVEKALTEDKKITHPNGVYLYQLDIPLTFTKDSFVTVEVTGKASADYQIIYPEITPYAFSNAIYVDHDLDGQWQAPGL